jgi:hypothetical protein
METPIYPIQQGSVDVPPVYDWRYFNPKEKVMTTVNQASDAATTDNAAKKQKPPVGVAVKNPNLVDATIDGRSEALAKQHDVHISKVVVARTAGQYFGKVIHANDEKFYQLVDSQKDDKIVVEHDRDNIKEYKDLKANELVGKGAQIYYKDGKATAFSFSREAEQEKFVKEDPYVTAMALRAQADKRFDKAFKENDNYPGKAEENRAFWKNVLDQSINKTLEQDNTMEAQRVTTVAHIKQEFNSSVDRITGMNPNGEKQAEIVKSVVKGAENKMYQEFAQEAAQRDKPVQVPENKKDRDPVR